MERVTPECSYQELLSIILSEETSQDKREQAKSWLRAQLILDYPEEDINSLTLRYHFLLYGDQVQRIRQLELEVQLEQAKQVSNKQSDESGNDSLYTLLRNEGYHSLGYRIGYLVLLLLIALSFFFGRLCQRYDTRHPEKRLIPEVCINLLRDPLDSKVLSQRYPTL